jgi:hypothetical protein
VQQHKVFGGNPTNPTVAYQSRHSHKRKVAVAKGLVHATLVSAHVDGHERLATGGSTHGERHPLALTQALGGLDL